ncbi:hypothetical protein [Thiomicrospira microaerophila]|nr:hypothetical protein [Thiomicrospira microaerophila]
MSEITTLMLALDLEQSQAHASLHDDDRPDKRLPLQGCLPKK